MARDATVFSPHSLLYMGVETFLMRGVNEQRPSGRGDSYGRCADQGANLFVKVGGTQS